jgi:hypothetical protein
MGKLIQVDFKSKQRKPITLKDQIFIIFKSVPATIKRIFNKNKTHNLPHGVVTNLGLVPDVISGFIYRVHFLKDGGTEIWRLKGDEYPCQCTTTKWFRDWLDEDYPWILRNSIFDEYTSWDSLPAQYQARCQNANNHQLRWDFKNYIKLHSNQSA